MLIALFTILFTVLIGGTDTPFVIPDADKVIKKTVVDKDRRNEALFVVKAYKQEWKDLGKLKKNQAKQLSKFVKSYNTDVEVFNEVFSNFRKQRNQFNGILVDSRYKLQGVLTTEEWTELMEAAYASLEKNDKKFNKAEIKSELRSNKKLVKVGESIEAVFEEEDKKIATQLLEEFEASIVNLLFENQNYRENVLKTLESKKATKEELAAVVNKVEKLRTETQDAFVNLYLGLTTISTEKEWPKLARQLNKFI
jgi:hypothetical protein